MSDQSGNVIFYVLALILPLSALAARRLPLKTVAMSALAWIGIFAIGLAGVAFFDSHGSIGRSVHTMLFGADQSVVGRELRVPVAEDGHFYVQAKINGLERTLLVDSGASYTGLTTTTAAAAKVTPEQSSRVLLLDTANGTVEAQPASIATLQIGGITAKDAPAAIASEFGNTEVLGMSFLSKLKSWRVEGKTLVMIPEAD